jgi:hypothetical protein
MGFSEMLEGSEAVVRDTRAAVEDDERRNAGGRGEVPKWCVLLFQSQARGLWRGQTMKSEARVSKNITLLFSIKSILTSILVALLESGQYKGPERFKERGVTHMK